MGKQGLPTSAFDVGEGTRNSRKRKYPEDYGTEMTGGGLQVDDERTSTVSRMNRQCHGWSGDAYKAVIQLAVLEAFRNGSSNQQQVTKLASTIPCPKSLGRKRAERFVVTAHMNPLPTIDLGETGKRTARELQVSFALRAKDCQPLDESASWNCRLCKTCAPLGSVMSGLAKKARDLIETTTTYSPTIAGSGLTWPNQVLALRKEQKRLGERAKERESRLKTKISELKEELKRLQQQKGAGSVVAPGPVRASRMERAASVRTPVGATAAVSARDQSACALSPNSALHLQDMLPEQQSDRPFRLRPRPFPSPRLAENALLASPTSPVEASPGRAATRRRQDPSSPWPRDRPWY